MNRLLSPAIWLWQRLNRLTRVLVGDISWRPPGWAAVVGGGVAKRPGLSLGAIVGLIVLLVAGSWFWHWYANRPKPQTVDWTVLLAPQPDPDNQFQPRNLTLTFDASVAKLELIGKDVTSSVTLTPNVAGKWTWNEGNQLGFAPTENWLPGTTYRIDLAPTLFTPHARLETFSKNLRTTPFAATIGDAIFYVNPKDPSVKQITATLTFSYPVDRKSLEDKLTLETGNGVSVFQNGTSDHDRCTVTYDKLDRVVYVRSGNVSMPRESAFARLSIPNEVISAAGQVPIDESVSADVRVPSMSSLFYLSSMQALIATDTEGDPEQAVILTSSVGVKPELLAKSIHAWILPRDKDKDKKGDDPYAWQSRAEVTLPILERSTIVPLKLVPSQEEYATLHSFKLKVPENAYVYVTVDKGLSAVGGFTLADNFASVSRMPPYPRSVHIMHDGALLALSGERKLSIQSRGVEQLEFQLDRVTPSSINHLVSQSEGNFQSPVFNSDSFNEANIAEHVVRRQALENTDTSKNDYSALDFSEFVNGEGDNKGKLGLFILRVLGRTDGDDGGYYKKDGSLLAAPGQPTTKKTDDDEEGQDPLASDELLADRRMILITDLGLLIKDNADGSHDVFVQSIKTGQPVGGATVEVLGKNGVAVVTGETDDTGQAHVPSLLDFSREKKPVAYVVHLGQDVSFLPFGREDRVLNFSRFDTSGVTGLAPHDLTAFVFTDRGIYRPGDEAKLGLIVKQRDWQGKLDGVPLRLEVLDPRGNVAQSRLLKLSASGFLEATFPTRETSATGKYQVNCYLVKGKDDETLLGSQSLRVAEFLPDRLKIKTTLSTPTTEGWVTPQGLKGLVSLLNLYGTPSVGHKVKGKVTLNPSQFSFDKYADYSFTDPYYNADVPRKAHEEDLPDQTTDDTGAATFDLSMANLESSAYQMSLLTEGFEKEGGRSVTSGAEVLVSPRAWLVGVKPDGDFSYVHLNSQRSARFLAVDSQLKPVSVEHLKLKLVERRYVSVLTQQSNGNYAYDSVLKEIPVSETEEAISDKGLDWPLPTTQPGDFAARLYDDHGDLMADVRFSVVGMGNISRSLEKNAELTAKLSKPEYLPGETIEVEVTAPYVGAGLLTIERDKVYAHAWFQTTTTASVQKIQLPKDFEGNGYLNVSFVRAIDSKEIYMSPFSYTVLPFKVNQEARHTHISIDVPKVAVPGEPLQMKISASRPTQAVVYAVDEGILQVARYTLPDPLGYFFRKQALEVGTRQTLDMILPEYSIVKELAAAGGDEGDDALAHHLNPFKRKRDKPVAYWSGIVDIGPEMKTFTYDVPDYYAGTLRVMVVANTADAVGSDQKTLQVRGPFVISPNVPTFVAPGDTFDVSSAIANNITGSGADAQVKLTLEASDGIEVLQKPADSVAIAEGRDTSVHWLLRAKDKLGDADLTITAESGGQKTSLASHLSIRPPSPYLTTLTSGYFKDDQKQVPITRKLYPEYRKVTALLSPLPQGLTRGLGDYLEHYEYGCTEQLVSKAFPTLVSGETMQQGLPRAQVAQKIQAILDVAATRQNDEGAFGLWMAEPDIHFDMPSLHIVLFMTEAKEQGYDIPEDMLTRGLSHLQQDANGTPQDFREARNQAYAIYLLARNGTVVTNALEHNRAWFEENAKGNWNNDLAAVYEAASYSLLKDQDQANKLIQGFHLEKASPWPVQEIDYDDDLGRSAQYVYLLSRNFPERLKSLSEDDLMGLANPIISDDYNTLSSALAILALDSYARAMKQSFLADSVEIDAVSGTATKKLDLSPGLYPFATFDTGTDSLIFKKAGGTSGMPRGLFYQISESGFEQAVVTTPISDGIEVSREYRNEAGQPVTTAKLGEELTVVLRVRSTDQQNLQNVAISDLLPGGFEIVEESVHTGACTYGWGEISYVDVREDRLLAFGTVTGDVTEITYKIKATNKGTYAVPPPQAEAMYHQKIRARGISGSLTVQD